MVAECVTVCSAVMLQTAVIVDPVANVAHAVLCYVITCNVTSYE